MNCGCVCVCIISNNLTMISLFNFSAMVSNFYYPTFDIVLDPKVAHTLLIFENRCFSSNREKELNNGISFFLSKEKPPTSS